MAILRLNRNDAHPVKFTDSTDIPVCLPKNANTHRVMRGLAAWGRSAKGLYYGLKIHITADWRRQILSLAFSPANTDDRVPFLTLNKDLAGIFVADAGYVSAPLAQSFNSDVQL